MSGITSGVGLFSGIDTATLIQQLLAIEARPKILVQQQIIRLQTQQGALLDINTRLSGLKSAAAAFRLNKTFAAMQAVSSSPDVLSATASTSASEGSYSFIVDRLVSTQQLLSRGFVDRDSTGLGATAFRFEPADARLDRDTPLTELNGGDGVQRGKIVITQSGAGSVTVDLSRAATVGEVLEAINSAAGLDVTASVSGGHLVITADTGTITVDNAAGYSTASSLGIQTTSATAQVVGSDIYRLGANTSLRSLNDGLGVHVSTAVGSPTHDFSITISGTASPVLVDIGVIYDASANPLEPAVTSVGGVLDRINDALADAGISGIVARISTDGTRLELADTSGAARTITVAENLGKTAADLGILGSASTTLTGSRILAGLNSTLARNLNGGTGIAGTGSISITARDGSVHTVTIDTASSVSAILAEFAADTAGKITASLNDTGTGLLIADTTGGSGNLIITGATAESLGIDTDPAGVAAAALSGSDLEHRYLDQNTLLSSLNGGKGIGTGKIRITDSVGLIATIDVTSSQSTLADVIKLINSAGTRARARINDAGDGLLIYEEVPSGESEGSQKIKIEDVGGSVASALRIRKEAAGTGASNRIDGSFETEVSFSATDSLAKVAETINAAGAGVRAAIINDGTGSTPFRLALSAAASGRVGRFIVDTGSFDLGLSQLDAGHDSRVFFGSGDPASAVLLTNSTNTLDNAVSGVTIDLKSADPDPVTLTLSRDTGAVESAVNAFITAFNSAIERIDFQTRYDSETKARGPLLGDGTTLQLRNSLYQTVQGEGIGLSGRFSRLADVGVTVGSGGTLTLDRDRLRAALAEDPQAVADLFTAYELDPDAGTTDLGDGISANDPDAPRAFLRLGVAGRIEELVERYTNSFNGVLTGRDRSLASQIDRANQRIADFDARLALRQQVLQRQFTAMEQAIAMLQSQQSSLASIAALR